MTLTRRPGRTGGGLRLGLLAALFAVALLSLVGLGTGMPGMGGGTARAAAASTYRAPWIGGFNHVRFCGSDPVDFSNVSQWATPHGCYAKIFYPGTAGRPVRPSFGWCNWIPEEAHTQYLGYTILRRTKHFGSPVAGAVVWFNPGDQGAGGDGHWAQLVAIGPNGWGLVEEMNFTWRGAGWKKVDYRFIRLYASGTAYLYP